LEKTIGRYGVFGGCVEMVNMQTALLSSVSFCDPARKFHASYSGSNGRW
jgi:hypothetical protein